MPSPQRHRHSSDSSEGDSAPPLSSQQDPGTQRGALPRPLAMGLGSELGQPDQTGQPRDHRTPPPACVHSSLSAPPRPLLLQPVYSSPPAPPRSPQRHCRGRSRSLDRSVCHSQPFHVPHPPQTRTRSSFLPGVLPQALPRSPRPGREQPEGRRGHLLVLREVGPRPGAQTVDGEGPRPGDVSSRRQGLEHASWTLGHACWAGQRAAHVPRAGRSLPGRGVPLAERVSWSAMALVLE